MHHRILSATKQHIPYLPFIESAAETLFSIDDLPMELRKTNTSLESFTNAQNQNLLWVSVNKYDTPIAFLLAGIVDGCMHITEFDVHPTFGRRGIGTQLLKHSLFIAKQRAFSAVTLTTFEHLPWNAPFYSSHGFKILDTARLDKELTEILNTEKYLGLKRRVAMRLKLQLNASSDKDSAKTE